MIMILLASLTSTTDKCYESKKRQKKTETKKKNNNEYNDEIAVNKDQINFENESEPQYKLNDDWSISPIKEEMNEEVVLLTIDDAPDKYGLEMAKTLKELDAHAVFFR